MALLSFNNLFFSAGYPFGYLDGNIDDWVIVDNLNTNGTADFGIVRSSAGYNLHPGITPFANGSNPATNTSAIRLTPLFGPFDALTLKLDTLVAGTGGTVAFTGLKADGVTIVTHVVTLDTVLSLQTFRLPDTFNGLIRLDIEGPVNFQFDDIDLRTTITGTAGNDLILAEDGAWVVSANAGNDDISYPNGSFNNDDAVDGGAGDDELFLRGPTVLGGVANVTNVETIHLISGTDTTGFGGAGTNERFDYGVVAVDAFLAAGQTRVINAPGLAGDETLIFNAEAETDGQYIVRAGGSYDTLIGGALADELWGGGGNDTLVGGLGADILAGEAGNDFLDGGGGADTMYGVDGNDIYIVDSPSDAVIEISNEGFDTVHTAIGDKNAPGFQLYYIPEHVENLVATSNAGQGVGGNALNNAVTAGTGQDLIAMHQGGTDNVNAGAGADYIWFGDSLTAVDVVNGGLGRDTLAILGPYANLSLGANITNIERIELFSSGGPFTYTITLADSVNSPHPNFFEVVALSLTSTEHLNFDGSSDTDSRYFIRGGSGNDVLRAGAGNDRIVGNDGNDQLLGNAGNDTLIGGNGSDVYDTGTGTDTIEVASAGQSTGTGHDIISGFDPTVDRINVSGTFAGWGAAQTGALSTATFDAQLAAAVNGALGNNQAVRFTANAGDQSGKTFVVYDANGDGSYTAGTDYVFQFVNPPVNLESHAIFV